MDKVLVYLLGAELWYKHVMISTFFYNESFSNKSILILSHVYPVATKHASEEIRPDSLPLAGNKQVNETGQYIL